MIMAGNLPCNGCQLQLKNNVPLVIFHIVSFPLVTKITGSFVLLFSFSYIHSWFENWLSLTIKSFQLKGSLGNWLHYYRVVRSKLVFYNVLTTSINNTHIKRKNLKTICSSETKRKNLKTICSSETISSRIFGSAPNSPNTLCHLCNLVGLTSL
jgi:hypothetical protein